MFTTIIRQTALLVAIVGCVLSTIIVLMTDVWWKEVIALASLYILLSLVSAIFTVALFYDDIRES